MKFTKKLLLTSFTLGAAITPIATMVSCGSGNRLADLRVVLDEQEVKMNQPRLEALGAALGKSVGFATLDNDRIVQQLQQLKLSGHLPDVLQAQDPALMKQEGIIQTFTLRDLFGNNTWVNDDLSGVKLKADNATDKDFYDKIAEHYDMNIFAQVVGKSKPTDIASATAFLDAPLLGLPTGVTGWGIWIRRNKMDETKVITHYLKDGVDAPIPSALATKQNAFATAWANDPKHKKLDGSDLTKADIYGTVAGSGVGKGTGFKTTPVGIEAFVAMSADAAQKNASWAVDNWYSIGFTGQYQRIMAAFYNAKQTTAAPILWDGPSREGMIAEQFATDGSITYGTGTGNAAENIAFDDAHKKFQNAVLLNRLIDTPTTVPSGHTVTSENKFWERWYNTTLSYSNAKTSEEAYGVKDPAKNFWFAEKKAAGLAFGQQWMTWPLKQDLTKEADASYKSVVSVAVPFSAKGTQSYALAEGLSGQKKTNALKLLRLMFSKNSQKLTAGKLQSTQIEDGTSISLAVTQNAAATDKNSLPKNMFRPVLPATNVATPNPTFISSYENPTSGDEAKWPLYSGVQGAASTYIRAITSSNRADATGDLSKWLAWYNANFKSEIQKAIHNAVIAS